MSSSKCWLESRGKLRISEVKKRYSLFSPCDGGKKKVGESGTVKWPSMDSDTPLWEFVPDRKNSFISLRVNKSKTG